MIKPDFEKAQRAATQLLLQQKISSLKFDVRNFSFEKRIIIDSIQHYCFLTGTQKEDYTYNGYSGAYVLKLINGLYVILYDEDDSNEHHRHWGIAHELGHIYLEHDDGEKEEIEAHFFAAQLLMPEVVIRYALKLRGRITSDDIYDCFNVSQTAARKRINTLNNKMIRYFDEDKLLLRKTMFLVEQKFLQFEVIIPNTLPPYAERIV